MPDNCFYCGDFSSPLFCGEITVCRSCESKRDPNYTPTLAEIEAKAGEMGRVGYTEEPCAFSIALGPITTFYGDKHSDLDRRRAWALLCMEDH